MKNWGVVCFVAIVQLMIGLGSFCAQTAEAQDKPVVGVILPFSSAFEDIAVEQQRAVELALAESGSAFEVVFRDGGADVDTAVQAFQDLVRSQENLATVVSCSSWASSAIHPLAAEKDIFHVAIGSAALKRTEPGHTIRLTVGVQQEQEQLAAYLTDFERIAVLAMDNNLGSSWIRMLEDRFPKQVVAAQKYNPQQMDIAAQLATIEARDPEALVLISAGEAATIAKQARQAGIKAQLVGTRPIQRAEVLAASAFTNGLVYTYPSYNQDHSFMSAFTDRYGLEPGFFGVEAYDLCTTLSRALEQGQQTPKALFEWYAGNTFTGALGKVTFANDGDASYPYIFKKVTESGFRVAEFQFPMLLTQTAQELNAIFKDMDRSVAAAAEQLSTTGLRGDRASAILETLFNENQYAYNCVTVDATGTIVNVAPKQYSSVIGEDISGQEQIIRLHETHQPVLSQAIKMVEGFVGIDLEHPVFGQDGGFIGSVSVLTQPDFFGSIISRKVHNFPVEIFVLQRDGTTIYDVNAEEIGKNAFADPIYDAFPSLKRIARKMVSQAEGEGTYRFQDRHMEHAVAKQLLWTSIGLHGTNYRLALTYEAGKIEELKD